MGGILGVLQNECFLQNSYNTGAISGGTSVGGICGEAMGSEAYVKNSYNVRNCKRKFTSIWNCILLEQFKGNKLLLLRKNCKQWQ